MSLTSYRAAPSRVKHCAAAPCEGYIGADREDLNPLRRFFDSLGKERASFPPIIGKWR